MLPPFIIEEIRIREQGQRARETRPQLDLPPQPAKKHDDGESQEEQRGVVIVDVFG